jgi:hypothetical protein
MVSTESFRQSYVNKGGVVKEEELRAWKKQDGGLPAKYVGVTNTAWHRLLKVLEGGTSLTVPSRLALMLVGLSPSLATADPIFKIREQGAVDKLLVLGRGTSLTQYAGRMRDMVRDMVHNFDLYAPLTSAKVLDGLHL